MVLRYLGRGNTMKLFSNFKGDLSGAFSAAIITFPLSVAYGLIVFEPLGPNCAPQAALTGLYAAVFAGFFASFFGGTALQVTGPKAPLTLVMASVVTELIGQLPTQVSGTSIHTTVVCLVFLCVLFGGIFQILFGIMRVGSLIKYLPYPVFSGFLNGIAILLILKQIKPLLGVSSDITFVGILNQPGVIQPITLLIGLSTLVAIYLSRRSVKKIPASLMGLCFGTALYYLLLNVIDGISLGPLVGYIPTALPRPGPLLVWFQMVSSNEIPSLFPQLIVAGLALSLLGSIDSLLSSVVSDRLVETRHDSNRELVAQGIGNIVASFFGGLPSAGSTPRTIASFKAGGRTRLSGMLCSLWILLIVIALGPLVGKIPLVVMAGIVIAVGIDMIDRWTISLLMKLGTTVEERKGILVNLAVTLLVTVITVCTNLIVALGIGFVIASILFISKMARSIIKRKYTGEVIRSKAVRCQAHNKLLDSEGGRIVVFELQGPIFFGSAENLAKEIENSMRDATYCIIDMKRVNEIDSTGANIILQINSTVKSEGKYLLLSYVKENKSLWRFLVHMDVAASVGEDYFFSDTDSALEWAESHLLEHSFQVSDPCYRLELSQISVLSGFTKEELEIFNGRLALENYKRGELLIREGSRDRDLFILTKGIVSIKTRLAESNRNTRLVSYGPGVIFGEFAFLDGGVRSADVWADEESEVLRLSVTDFETLRRSNPDIATKLIFNISLELSQRLRLSSREVRALEDS